MSVTNGCVCSSDSPFGGSMSTTSSYYFQSDGDTIRCNTPRTPSSSSANGYPGEICWDSSYLYVCIATDTWTRIALVSF
jgi:hypothetical protein